MCTESRPNILVVSTSFPVRYGAVCGPMTASIAGASTRAGSSPNFDYFLTSYEATKRKKMSEAISRLRTKIACALAVQIENSAALSPDAMKTLIRRQVILRWALCAFFLLSCIPTLGLLIFIFMYVQCYADSIIFLVGFMVITSSLLLQDGLLLVMQGVRFFKTAANYVDIILVLASPALVLSLLLGTNAVPVEPIRISAFMIALLVRVFRNLLMVGRVFPMSRRTKTHPFITLQDEDEDVDEGFFEAMGDIDDDGVLAALEREFDDYGDDMKLK
ncbi:hypothetical protein J8273_0289 [Carpediemonas membranifera]|uniref:Uncharacterized protein n=1 Tax=Carpediemonas membranifera TaxID=201153 RepID=A0A8J6B3Q7_9EUKA|nr:hypothetical protein J8273_0289 [Carpediemonas membranifera]|eukprot:KAG9395073.1 hypothetical protein J8273_0289 [Carpediemonas membranifera]